MKRASLVVRGIAIALVAVAPWLPTRARKSDQQSVVVVADRSLSMGDGLDVNFALQQVWSKANLDVRLGAVAFAAKAELLAPVGASAAPRSTSPVDGWSSDLASGIRLARAALPNAGHRSIVLVTDGRSTRGDAEAEVRAAAAEGIRVDVLPMAGERPSQPMIHSMKPRALRVAEGESVALDLEVSAPEQAMIEWSRDGVPMRGEVFAGTKSVVLLDTKAPPGPHVYEARVRPWTGARRAPSDETSTAQRPSLAAVSVEGRVSAVVFSGTGMVPPVLLDSLKESGLEARLLPIERVSDAASYAGADLVVLADVRVSGAASDDTALTRASQSALIDYVQEGGGLLVTGGVFGLAPEYAGTPLARILPVEIEDRGHVEDPPVALAIMLDRSGSMGAVVGGHTKIELAIEASLAAADSLRASDQVAIASVDTESHWDVPLGLAERLPAMRADVRQVTAGGGGIFVYTALRDAYQALAEVKAPLRHVILFSDTGDSEEQFRQEDPSCSYRACATAPKTAESLAHDARVRGITTTVVGIGEESAQDTAFLRRLAGAAGGRFYLTSEGTDLRRIFLSETRVLSQSNLREQKTRVTAAGPHPILEGLDVGKLPALAGFVETRARAGGEHALLLSEGARPFLSTWRYGLGRVGTLTTDLGEGWGADWATSAEATQLLRQTTRHLLRQKSAQRADAAVRFRDGVVEVTIDLPPDAPESSAPRAVDLFAVDKVGKSRRIQAPLEASGPGQWRARAPASGESIVVVRARDAQGAVMAEALGQEDQSAELAGAGVDEHVLRELARLGEGRYAPDMLELFTRTQRPGREREPMWPWALSLAAALVTVDLFLRRWGRRGATEWSMPRGLLPGGHSPSTST